MKKLVVALIVLGLLGYGIVRWRQKEEAPAGPSYREAAVERGDLRLEILATGTVKPQNRVALNSPVSGRIEEILVDEGDRVKRGQILAWISSTDRAALLDAARARGPEELTRWSEIYKPAPLVAPLDGDIIARNAEPGQSMSGEKPVLVMSDRLIVEAQVDETDIARVFEGQAATVRLDAYLDRPLSAVVDHIAYDADTEKNVTLYDVDVLPKEPAAFLRSGMSANINFLVAETNGVLLVPSAAVQRENGKAYALVPGATPEAEPARVEVTTGLDDGRQVEIRGGLDEGATVLLREVALAAAPGGKEQPKNPLLPFNRMGRPPRRP